MVGVNVVVVVEDVVVVIQQHASNARHPSCPMSTSPWLQLPVGSQYPDA